MNSFNYNYGLFYAAPALDMSFIRILQQNGRATVSSTASVLVTNRKKGDMPYGVSFAPEYQNITKDGDHRMDVAGSDKTRLDARIKNVVITAGPAGVVNFEIALQSTNVVERNNRGVEIADQMDLTAFASLAQGQEKVICSWTRTNTVEQTIGVPFLCELPVLKYIFGTTTNNMESTHYFVTVKPVPVTSLDNIEPGIVAEFDEICKK